MRQFRISVFSFAILPAIVCLSGGWALSQDSKVAEGWRLDLALDSDVLQGRHAIANVGSCSQCHTGKISSSDLSGNIRYTEYTQDALIRQWVGLDLQNSEPSVLFGEVRISNLQDQTLRLHLRLEDKPALLVVAEDALPVDESAESAVEGNDEEPAELGEVAGLEAGDVILKINGKEVSDVVALSRDLVRIRDESVKIDGIRQGEPVELRIALDLIEPVKTPFQIGVSVEEPSEALRSQLKLYANEGVIVTSVVDESPAATVGIQLHDILLRADRIRLTSMEDLRKSVQASGGNEVTLTLMRAGSEMEVLVTPVQEQPSAVCPGQHSWRGLILDQQSGENQWLLEAVLDQAQDGNQEE